MNTTDGISWPWRIHITGVRDATDPTGRLTLLVGDRHHHPVRWVVLDDTGELASGEVWHSHRYTSLVREAMYQAELAARELQGRLQ